MNENDVVALTRDLPQFGLRQGDTGTVLSVEDTGFVVEFLDNRDGTIALLTLDDVDIRPSSPQESSTHARPEPLAPGAHLPIADVRSKASAAGETRFSHIDEAGQAHMVDVTAKDETLRVAVAEGRVVMQPETLRLLVAGEIAKGNVLTTAQIAGIMAAKRTHELIPMCHPLLLTGIDVQLEPDEGTSAVQITATVRTTGKTGVEMEALTAVSIAGLTVYDMCKAVDRGMRLEEVRLVSKSGGASGDYRAG
jgi:cyclic pyranopterin phosphate synthase